MKKNLYFLLIIIYIELQKTRTLSFMQKILKFNLFVRVIGIQGESRNLNRFYLVIYSLVTDKQKS